MLRSGFIRLLITMFLLIQPNNLFACWGTRPLAMGGAFSGLADDANAIYWNPAGLVLSKRLSITTMHNIGERNDSNYDQYLGIVLPLGTHGTLGAAFIYNKDILYYVNGDKYGSRQSAHYQFGYGTYLKRDWNLSLGINVKAVTKDKNTITYTDRDEWFDLDLGMLWGFGNDVGTKKMFSLGFLLQNIIGEGDSKENFRPGFSFCPDEKTVLSLELYDGLGNTRNDNVDVSQCLRMGVERRVSKNIVFRLGGYDVNNDATRAYTGGIGLKAPTSWDIDLEFDWTAMYWDEANTSTQFIGLTYLW